MIHVMHKAGPRTRLTAAVGSLALLGVGAFGLLQARAETGKIGEAAPAFTELNSAGEKVSLSDFAGKTVVLEWTNDGCPFVQKHYNSGNMQKTQEAAAYDGVVWLTVISSKPGAQGYVSGKKADELTASRNAQPTHVLLDPDGSMERAYGAKTTPHMYVIKGDGQLAYKGAIDSIRSADVNDVPKADNYVLAALKAVKAGKTPDPALTPSYGCSVKY
ncbi:MAG: thioredoxin family protein [Hyphomonadaceae bacterium]